VPGYRPARIAELIHQELAQRLREDVKDPRLVDLSITRVEVSRDLKRATVHYLPLGGGEPSKALSAGLSDVARFLRGPVGRALGIRHAPELVFVFDTTTEAAIRVSRILAGISPQPAEEAAAAPEEEET
jgi:ribosome-binding factor A